MPEDLTREPGWPYSTLHFAPNPNPKPQEMESLMLKDHVSLLNAWCVGAIGGLYCLWALTPNPMGKMIPLDRIMTWSTWGAVITTLAWATICIAQGYAKDARKDNA